MYWMSACLLFPRTRSIKEQVECSLELWIRETPNSWAVGNNGSCNHSWVTHPRSELATFKKLLQFFVCLVSEHTVGGSRLVSMNHAQLHTYQKTQSANGASTVTNPRNKSYRASKNKNRPTMYHLNQSVSLMTTSVYNEHPSLLKHRDSRLFCLFQQQELI